MSNQQLILEITQEKKRKGMRENNVILIFDIKKKLQLIKTVLILKDMRKSGFELFG